MTKLMLTDSERRLVLEAALAGSNHGLLPQVRDILPALHLLVPDAGLRAVCRAVLLLGLGQPEQAQQALEECDTPEADVLRSCCLTLIKESPHEH